ncbi:hypothetical protein BbiDN127_A0052 (plasmid) [Borreliella bissettiae DN127]|uniref:Uncharacterized protein n=1 Tax=Borrelia bissettiae (strain DSM 17990 / CIP 109136 / DN127) TaxID=521010 RepID=G0APH7_BORBD|nr:hypothetical protein BbiDN127_A0052 [Borreliella bissettiae DN127]
MYQDKIKKNGAEILEKFINLKIAPPLQHQITNAPKGNNYKLLNFKFYKTVRIKI